MVIPVFAAGTMKSRSNKMGYIKRTFLLIIDVLTAIIDPIRLNFKLILAKLVRSKILMINNTSLASVFMKQTEIIKDLKREIFSVAHCCLYFFRICDTQLLHEIVQAEAFIVLHCQAEFVACLCVEHENQLLPEALQEQTVEALLPERQTPLDLTLPSKTEHVVHGLLGNE